MSRGPTQFRSVMHREEDFYFTLDGAFTLANKANFFWGCVFLKKCTHGAGTEELVYCAFVTKSLPIFWTRNNKLCMIHLL